MTDIKTYDAIIIGAGHSGLVSSFYLKTQGINHCILEQSTVASSWLTRTWDSFNLVTPNWMNQLPGLPSGDVAGDQFLTKDQYIKYLRVYQKKFDLPVIEHVEVKLVDYDFEKNCYLVTTNSTCFRANNVIVATSSFNDPFIPAFSKNIKPNIKQLHSSQYQNPKQISPGAILVVGGGQSGVQISEELLNAGKKVYLSVSKVGRVPRRYRNKDITEWIYNLKEYETVTPSLEQLNGKFPNNPNISKVLGNVYLDLYDLVHRGLILLGSVASAANNKLQFRDNIAECLDYSEQTLQDRMQKIDKVLGFSNNTPAKKSILVPSPEEIDLDNLNITTVIWATGFRFNFKFINIPVFDSYGFPITDNGVTKFPGLYFVGLKGSHKLKTGLIFGTQEQAQNVVDHLHKNRKQNKIETQRLKARL